MISFLHARTTASLSSAVLEQARRSTRDTTRHSTSRHVTSRLARHVVLVVSWRVVPWRNKWNLGSWRDSQQDAEAKNNRKPCWLPPV